MLNELKGAFAILGVGLVIAIIGAAVLNAS